MIGGIKNLLQALKPAGPLSMANTTETTQEKYSHVILIDYDDGTTGYHEHAVLKDVNEAVDELKSGEDICYLRVCYSDGTRNFWEHPDKNGSARAAIQATATHLLLIDHQDHSTSYQECGSERELTLTAEDLKTDDGIAYFRVRYPDGTEFCWENPNKEDADQV